MCIRDSCVAIQHWYPVARCGHAHLAVYKSCLVVIYGTQYLLRLRLELVLFARDKGYHVVDDVHATDSRIPGARDSLHGDHTDGLDGTELGLDCYKWNNQADDCAIGIADEKALFEFMMLPLMFEDIHMVEIDGRDDERDYGIASVILCV